MSVRKSSCALLAIAALVLAGCGGGGTTATTPEPDPVTPPAPKPATPATPATPAPREKTPAEKVSDLLASTGQEIAKALGTRPAAEMALKAARDSANQLFDSPTAASPALNVMGESSEAQKRAQAILDANANVEQALSDANAALAALETAKGEADKLPDGTANLATLKANIAKGITDAKSNRDAVKKIKDDKGANSLVEQVAKVTGGGAGTRKAADIAADVALIIAKAGTNYIGKTTTLPSDINGLGLSLPTYGTAPGTSGNFANLYRDTANDVTRKNDAPPHAFTWEEIVGKDKVEKKTIGSSAADGVQPMASFEGMDAGTGNNRMTLTAPNLSGLTHTYLGITGVAYCLEQRCPVTNGKLGAGWYWTVAPENRHKHWVRKASGYEEFTDYAHYGYWIRGETDAGLVIENNQDNGIKTFGFPHNQATASSALGESSTIPGDNKATYTGKALGISVVTKDKKAIKSGQFTADVELTATFAAEPKVTGTVKNFKGNAVGSNWSLTLEQADLVNSAPGNLTPFGTTDEDTEDATNTKGRWHARAYGGSATERPTGITGDFYAFFSDGRAMAGYGTRKK